MCHLYCNPINLCRIQRLSCSMPNTPLFHQQSVNVEESEKQRQQETVVEEHKELKVRILMFFCTKGLIWVPTYLREWECVWILNRRGRKYCVVKGLLPGKQTSNISMSPCDNVPPGGWGWGDCETFKNWNFNNSGITYIDLTRSVLFEKVWLEKEARMSLFMFKVQLDSFTDQK